LLPDHLHAIWRLPENDLDYSRRWSIIKRRFTQRFRFESSLQAPFWQERFWAHRVNDENDYVRHMDYIHYNTVKHGLVDSVQDWLWSSFHRAVKSGLYLPDWGRDVDFALDIGNE